MRGLLFPLIALGGLGCVATQPVSSETVAAFEVPLPRAEDRMAFVAVLRAAARAEGGHVDAASDGELRDTAAAMPQAKMSIHAAVWRGADDKESWATIMDQADHIGQVWIMFSRGEDEALARRFRERAIRDIRSRWPDTISLPIINRRTIPLRSDLVKTPDGYRLTPSAALKYDRKK